MSDPIDTSLTGTPSQPSAEPFTPETLEEMWNLYVNRPSSVTGQKQMKEQTVYVMNSAIKFYTPAFLSGTTGDALMLAVLEKASTGSVTYKTHYLKRIVIPFLVFSGRITEWQATQWKKKVPNSKSRRPSHERILSPSQLRDLFVYTRTRAIRHGFTGWRAYVYLSMLYITGARTSQPIDMRYPEDVVFSNDTVHLKMAPQKGNSLALLNYSVPLDTRLPNGDTFGMVLETYLLYLPNDATFLFCRSDDPGKPYSKLGVNLKRTHYKPLGFDTHNHAFRALVGSIIANDVGIAEAQRYLNHKNIATTLEYVKPTRSDAFTEDVARKFANIMNRNIGESNQ